MTTPQMQNAGVAACASVNQAGGPNPQLPINKQFITDAAILASTSTAIDIQLRKVLLLLMRGPQTTIELRQRAVMMPAARVHTLRHEHGHNIITTLQAMFDAEGVRHSRCAKYTLVQAESEVQP